MMSMQVMILSAVETAEFTSLSPKFYILMK